MNPRSNPQFLHPSPTSITANRRWRIGLLELTGAVTGRDMSAQVLDDMDLEPRAWDHDQSPRRATRLQS